MERLAARHLLAADISIVGSELRVAGDETNDFIEVRHGKGDTLEVHSRSGSSKRLDVTSVNGAKISRIRLVGNDGDDHLVNSTKLFSRLYGGHGDDYLVGGSGTDYLYGFYGDDVLNGMAGNDSLYGSYDQDRIYGGEGHDRLYGNDGYDRLYGNDGHDYLYGGSSIDMLFGHEGNDVLYGESGSDHLYGHDGDDYISGGDGNDRIDGGGDDDSLHGDTGNDLIEGGAGNDRMWGGSGDDQISGEAGQDEARGGSGNDVIDGGSSSDHLWGDDGEDQLYGGTGDDRLFGGDDADFLDGGSGNDDLEGQAGHDQLYGGTGHDDLFGGSGNDSLFGGITGVDHLWGESGSDRFLNFRSEFQNDQVHDPNANDAVIEFRNAPGRELCFSGDRNSILAAGQFTDGEILQVDAALDVVHRRVGNPRLLKKAGGALITFHRLGQQIGGNFQVGGANSGGDVYLVNDTFSSQNSVDAVVFHELAHNWDTPFEAGEFVEEFREISNWTHHAVGNSVESLDDEWYFDGTSSFSTTTMTTTSDANGDTVRVPYGQTNPMEDWATMWEQYFNIWRQSGSHGVLNSGLATQSKLDVIDHFFNSLR